ncbi:MAG: response regulator [Lachnospira sp.]
MKKLWNFINKYMYNHNVPVESRISVMFMTVAIVAAAMGMVVCLLSGVSVYGVISVAVTMAVIMILMYIVYIHNKGYDVRIILVVAVIFILPVVWLTAGGLYSGVNIWFVYELLFIALALKGNTMKYLLALASVLDICCYIIQYYKPEYVHQLETTKAVYISTVGSAIIVGASIVVTVIWQRSIYNHESSELEKSNNYQKDFLANFSHELRSPINAIIGMNELILRSNNLDEIKKYGNNAFDAGSALLSLVNDILDFTKIQSGHMELVLEDYSTMELLKQSFNLVAVRAQEKNIELRVKNIASIPSRLYGDEMRVRQIITNLLTNAVKYTDEGYVDLAFFYEKLDEGLISLNIRVTDTGMGIPKENMEKMYDSFQRLDVTKNKTVEGTGLGLAITRSLVRQMRGTIAVESELGKGSTFTVRIPQKVIDPAPMGEYRPEDNPVIEKYKASFKASKARILVVDDIEMNIQVFIGLLTKTKIQIDSALSGAKALEMLENNKYDIIFMDHMMPGMDGVQTLHEIRKTDKETPVIVLTANAIQGAKEEYLAEGFNDYLTKPVMYKDLEKLISDYLPYNLLEQTTDNNEAYDDDDGKADSDDAIVLDELPDVEGVDWKYALNFFDTKTLLMQTLKNVYATLNSDADRIDMLADDIETEGMLDAYRIATHSLKGSTAMVGISMVSSFAKRLEKAAKNGEIDVIRSMTGLLTAEMRETKKNLDIIFAGADKKKIDNNEIILDLLNMLIKAACNCDIDRMDEIMESLLKYKFEDPINTTIEKLHAAETELDYEKVSKLAEEAKEKLTNIGIS